jgi:2-hydroxy-3-oxopropionate reductase
MAVPMATAGLELYAELKNQGLGDHDIAVVRQVISQLSDADTDTAMEGTVSA